MKPKLDETWKTLARLLGEISRFVPALTLAGTAVSVLLSLPFRSLVRSYAEGRASVFLIPAEYVEVDASGALLHLLLMVCVVALFGVAACLTLRSWLLHRYQTFFLIELLGTFLLYPYAFSMFRLPLPGDRAAAALLLTGSLLLIFLPIQFLSAWSFLPVLYRFDTSLRTGRLALLKRAERRAQAKRRSRPGRHPLLCLRIRRRQGAMRRLLRSGRRRTPDRQPRPARTVLTLLACAAVCFVFYSGLMYLLGASDGNGEKNFDLVRVEGVDFAVPMRSRGLLYAVPCEVGEDGVLLLYGDRHILLAEQDRLVTRRNCPAGFRVLRDGEREEN